MSETTLRELADLIAAFDAATAQLQASHDALQARVDVLTHELQVKNDALSRSLEEVSALKNYLANILESITDGVIAIDPCRRVVAFNQSAAETIVRIAIDPLGQPIGDVLPTACQELGRLLVQALTETRRFTNVEVTLPGDPPRILSVSASPIRNSEGAILGAVETFRDLTEIKTLEERASRQERLAALGEMAAGLAHEIRNPLGGIELYASHLKRSSPPESREAALAEKIMAAAASLNRIVSDMLDFTRPQEPVLRPAPIERVCRAALDLAATALTEKAIQVVEEYDTGGMRIPLDPDLMTRAFLNVILNATRFMDPGGELKVSAGFTEDRRYLWVRFADTGPGVPESMRERIFHPFFTTRRDGTGLGLAIVQRILQDHRGEVWVESNRPHGAVFCFRLPTGEGEKRTMSE